MPVDICGTGGSGLPRINTSTLASLLLAHCGLPVAKHGNRAAAGRFDSFNLLEALDVPIRFDAEKATRALETTHLAFLFAPDIFPVFRHFAPVRARIGVPTEFNVLGPLLNPFRPRRQFIGTAFAGVMGEVLESIDYPQNRHFIIRCLLSVDNLIRINQFSGFLPTVEILTAVGPARGQNFDRREKSGGKVALK